MPYRDNFTVEPSLSCLLDQFDRLFRDIVAFNRSGKTTQVAFVSDKVELKFFCKLPDGAMCAVGGIATQNPIFPSTLVNLLLFDFFEFWSGFDEGFNVNFRWFREIGGITVKNLLGNNFCGRNNEIGIGNNGNHKGCCECKYYARVSNHGYGAFPVCSAPYIVLINAHLTPYSMLTAFYDILKF